VAIFAEDPYIYGGGWTADASRKLTRFADLASTFHLPLIHLEDCPGFVIGKQSEEEGAIRFGSAALVALQHAAVPFACIIVRRAYGVAGASNNVAGRHAFRSCWPSGDWGSLPLEGGIEVGYKSELAEAPDRDLRVKEIKAQLNRLRSPHRSAETFAIEEIIDPRDTRPLLCEWARLTQRALKPGPVSFGYRP
jgi:acetyl-CoA carboxylase carboxyltransferase component